MLSQRVAHQALRRQLAPQPQFFSRAAFNGIIPPVATASQSKYGQTRSTATQKIEPDAAHEILVKQRLNRPVSPHLSIYRPQITWYGSGLNRITGSALSGGFYLFGVSYLAAPLFGWHLESSSIAAAFGAWPVAAKVLTKFTVALPFTYHSWNGIRHLVWDTGRELSNKRVQQTGWAVVGISVVSSAVLAFI